MSTKPKLYLVALLFSPHLISCKKDNTGGPRNTGNSYRVGVRIYNIDLTSEPK